MEKGAGGQQRDSLSARQSISSTESTFTRESSEDIPGLGRILILCKGLRPRPERLRLSGNSASPQPCQHLWGTKGQLRGQAGGQGTSRAPVVTAARGPCAGDMEDTGDMGDMGHLLQVSVTPSTCPAPGARGRAQLRDGDPVPCEEHSSMGHLH